MIVRGSSAMRFLPVFLDTAAGVAVVIGAGEPALGKLRLLRAAGARVRWFPGAADVAEEMLALSGASPLEISLADPLEADWSDGVAVVSAAGDPLDAQIAARARRLRIPVNVVDRPELSSLIFPAIVDRGEVIVAIDTETVVLVGAGPGDPDLLTLRALHALADADVVFYDELVSAEVLDRARRGAEQVFVGKRRGQDEINRRLVAAARAGRRVVRLKGGDPFVFGRGGEEVEYLRNAGVPVVVVPGITAALGCAAEVGLPLTLRNEAGKLAFITAQRAEDAAAIDWSGLADRQATVCVHMGLASAASVRDGVIAAGRDGATPAAVLARGTRPDAQAAVGRLDGLAALATAVGEGPAILVIGEVVARSTPWRAAQADALIARAAASPRPCRRRS